MCLPENHFPRNLAAKCPRFQRFGTPELASRGIENLLREVSKSHQTHSNPWITRINDIQLVHGWPFLWSRYWDGTLGDLIAGRRTWSTQDRFAALITCDQKFCDNLRCLIDWREAQATPAEPWLHMDHRLEALRKFYSCS